MKKLIYIVLSGLIMLFFCGCGKKSNDNSSKPSRNSATIETILESGKINESDFALGTKIEKIKSETKYSDENAAIHDPEEELTIDVGDKTTKLSHRSNYYYYENAKEDKGISSVVTFAQLYGLECGAATPDEVRVTFSEAEFSEKKLEKEDVYFISAPLSDCFALSCGNDVRRIDFIFADDVLAAINLIDKENWSFSK